MWCVLMMWSEWRNEICSLFFLLYTYILQEILNKCTFLESAIFLLWCLASLCKKYENNKNVCKPHCICLWFSHSLFYKDHSYIISVGKSLFQFQPKNPSHLRLNRERCYYSMYVVVVCYGEKRWEGVDLPMLLLWRSTKHCLHELRYLWWVLDDTIPLLT